MDAITLIVSALVTGIAAALKPAAEQAVKDAYAGLKKIIQDRYQISLSNLEQKPNSEAQKSAVEETLKEKNAHEDDELVNTAKALVETIDANVPDAAQTAQSVGVDWVRVKVEALTIKSIRGGEGGTALRATDSEFGKVDIGDINPDHNPKN